MGSVGTFQPAARVVTKQQDVWSVYASRHCVVKPPSLTGPRRSIVNEAAANTPKQPVINMGQGFL